MLLDADMKGGNTAAGSEGQSGQAEKGAAQAIAGYECEQAEGNGPGIGPALPDAQLAWRQAKPVLRNEYGGENENARHYGQEGCARQGLVEQGVHHSPIL